MPFGFQNSLQDWDKYSKCAYKKNWNPPSSKCSCEVGWKHFAFILKYL